MRGVTFALVLSHSLARRDSVKYGFHRAETEEIAMRILISLSATEQSREIAREAARRPWPANSKFLLLHVLDPFPFARLSEYVALHAPCSVEVIRIPSAPNKTSRKGVNKGGTR